MYGLAIHGGAGTLPRSQAGTEIEARYKDGLREALEAGYATLSAGGAALDAVMQAVQTLENNPLYNSAVGAVFTWDGRNELDAAIMSGSDLRAGAVCGVLHIQNPVLLARAVMEQSEHVMLAGAGAEEFALSHGFTLVPQSYFYTPERWQQLERIRSGDKSISPLTISHLGTVGAVALDSHGHLAASTSTGGMTGKRYNRIGDSPIIGAGTYADDRGCAVSATGHGEIFIRLGVAHDISARLRYGGQSLKDAVHEMVHGELMRMKGEGGVISIDAKGNIVMDFNADGMFRASRRENESAHIAIYRD